MPRRARDHTGTLVFHVLNRAAKRAVLFDDAIDYVAFEHLVQEAVLRFGIALFAYCIMPTHWHFLLTPHADGVLSRCMHWLTTTHARRWQDAHGLTGLGAVYQGRFKAIPVAADNHFLWVCRYVERNPLRAGLVPRAEEWPWSSLKFDGRERPAWLGEWPVPRPVEWRTHVNPPQTEAEIQAFRLAMKNRTPFGSDDWRQEVEELLGSAHGRRRGRPRKCIDEGVLFK